MWKTFSEIDILRIREEAEQTPRLALVGADDKTARFLSLLQRGPLGAEHLVTAIPTYRLPLQAGELAALANYDLRIVLLEDAQQLHSDSTSAELSASLAALLAQPAPLLLVQDPAQAAAVAVDAALGGQASGLVQTVHCTLEDDETIRKELLPAVIRLLPERQLAVGRAFPGLRPAVAQGLIASTSRTNAGYAAGTGLAEMIPGLGIPFAVADVVILTKNQVVMAYKLGLLMGENGTPAEIIPKVAGVVGAGFLWRQVARELVGFLPLGVVLKTAVAYAGTYATGQAVYHYFVTGEKLRQKELRRLFDDALEHGKEVAAHTVQQIRAKRQPTVEIETGHDKPARKKLKLSALGKRQPV
jgi:uncharacterized protein (DUF697 family)